MSCADATDAIRATLQAGLVPPIDGAGLDRLAAAIADYPDAALAAAIGSIVADIPHGAPAQNVARPLIELSLVLAAFKAPLDHRVLIAEACGRAGRSLADLPNQEELAPGGWLAVAHFYPARRRCLARAAREAAIRPDRAVLLQDLIAFDDAGTITRFAPAIAARPLSCEALGLGAAPLTPNERREFWLRHGDITGFSDAGDVLILHAGDVPQGLRGTLDAPTRARIAGAAAKPELWWWAECGWPPQQERRTQVMVERVPGFVRDGLRDGTARLILNCGHEISFVDGYFADRLRALADALRCDPKRIVYVAQNPNVVERYADLAKSHAVRASIVTIGSTPLLLPWDQTAASIATGRRRHYICFNNIPHLFRAAFVLRAARDDLLDRGHVSFNWGFSAPLPPGSQAITPERLRPYFPGMDAAALAALMARIGPRLPLRLDLGDGRALDSHGRGAHVERIASDLTGDAYVYVVTETDMETPDHATRFTEKLVKPLASCNPFILFGNAHVLAALRRMGFETFGDVLDESYDSIADPIARFDAAYRSFQAMCAMNLAELEALYVKLLPRLLHNRAHLGKARVWFIQDIRAAIAAAR